MPDQAPLKHNPQEAFKEDLTLPKDMINEIKAAASINTQANIEQNKDQPEHPEMIATQPPTE